MSKRILVTSTDLMMAQFLVPHIMNLSDNGYHVEIACSVVGERVDEIQNRLKGYIRKMHIVRLRRSPITVINFLGYLDMKHIVDKGEYDLIWTNEPVMGVVTRLAAKKARKHGTKVLYMTHGFHFFEGAPKKNWLVFYTIERWASRYCDVITTVNREDFKRAKKMHAPIVRYIHGIGINPERLSQAENQSSIRKELKLKESDFICISVGELNENKNHQVIIRALGELQDADIHYVICGKGNQLENLTKLAKEQKIQKNVHFLGYRMDILNLCMQSDLFVFPSYREGLPIAPLEAMFCGLPLITSNIRGPIDFMKDGETGYLADPNNVNSFASKIKKMKESPALRLKIGENNKDAVRPFLLNNSKKEILKLVNAVLES